jgi:hypothetical protein
MCRSRLFAAGKRRARVRPSIGLVSADHLIRDLDEALAASRE